MNNKVKRYDPINNDGTCGMCVEDADYGTYVEYADYAALEAECEKLQLKVMVWNDGKPYAALKAERAALAAELAAIKGQELRADPVKAQLLEALESIRNMTNSDDPESYRCDDREGCLDTVFCTADAAIAASKGGAQ